jgi:uncharacterized 2Fe-2S/4Fe-4S cluster protein (DUF4445 family)
MALALSAGLHINASCGGSGTCGKCKVRVGDGEVANGLQAKFTQEEVQEGYRLECTAQVMGDSVV